MLGWLRSFFWPASGKPPESNEVKLERIVLADGVARTLFDDYAEHRQSDRGDEEIGWVLLGLREGGRAIALAALPAGADRDAGAAHIRFNAVAQAVASRLIRQTDKRLQILGVVHTHPGAMRWPSEGDLAGDQLWIKQLRGGEGVFGIGTAVARTGHAGEDHIQSFGELNFSWYALGVGDERYRTLPVQVTLGGDLAAPARRIWDTIETHAEMIEHLCRQFARVQLEVVREEPADLLLVKIGLVSPRETLRLLLNTEEARYYWDNSGEVTAIDPQETNVVRAVHLIFAELAKDSFASPEERMPVKT